ncbi:MAG: Hsp20/alpha crystallin family protein [Chloroflexota bacterium]|nr:Hsp20/alpha crystallin family protein [Chloroflexota bacterium]
MNLVRWEPLNDMRQVMDRVLMDSVVRPHVMFKGVSEVSGMPLDIYQTPDEVVVKATIPGVQPEDVEITLNGDVLTIKSASKVDEEIKETEYLYRERRYGIYTRTVNLPADLQTDKAEALFENGVLTLRIPKAEEVKPRQIKVKTK